MFRSSYTLFQPGTPSAGFMMNSDLRRCSAPTHTHPYRSNNSRHTCIQPESEYCRLLSSFLQSQHVNQHTAISPTPLQHNTHTQTHTDVTNSLFVLSTEYRIKMHSRSSKNIFHCAIENMRQSEFLFFLWWSQFVFDCHVSSRLTS